MKRKMLIITSTSAASLLAFAVGQETNNNAPSIAKYSDKRGLRHAGRRPGCAKKASDLIGMEVKTTKTKSWAGQRPGRGRGVGRMFM